MYPPLSAGHRLGPFEIIRPLGSGAFAHVYEARHLLLDQVFALKVVHDVVAEEREQHGARVMSRLRHPAIVRVHFADRIDDRLVIAMDYVDGDTLDDVLRREGTLPPRRALEVAKAICSALEHIHSLEIKGAEGLAHLDL